MSLYKLQTHTHTYKQIAQLALKLCVWVPGYSVMRGCLCPLGPGRGPPSHSFFSFYLPFGLAYTLGCLPHTHTYLGCISTHLYTYAVYLSMLALKFAFRMTTHRWYIRGRAFALRGAPLHPTSLPHLWCTLIERNMLTTQGRKGLGVLWVLYWQPRILGNTFVFFLHFLFQAVYLIHWKETVSYFLAVYSAYFL